MGANQSAPAPKPKAAKKQQAQPQTDAQARMFNQPQGLRPGEEHTPQPKQVSRTEQLKANTVQQSERDRQAKISNVQDTAAALDTKAKLFQMRIDAEMAKAKECIAKNDKMGAQRALVRKNAIEKQLNNLRTQCGMLDVQTLNIEAAETTAQFVKATKEANDAMTSLNQEVNPDEMEKVLEDQADIVATAQETQDIINQNAALMGLAGNDADINAELEAMMAQNADEEALKIEEALSKPAETATPAAGSASQALPAAPAAAAVPASAPAAPAKEAGVDKELAELMATLGA